MFRPDWKLIACGLFGHRLEPIDLTKDHGGEIRCARCRFVVMILHYTAEPEDRASAWRDQMEVDAEWIRKQLDGLPSAVLFPFNE
jgi:hypothetical protein